MIPRVPGRLAKHAVGERIEVRLADHDPSRLAQAGNDRCIVRRDAREDIRRRSGRHPGDIEQILDRKRDTEERPPGFGAIHNCRRRGKRPTGIDVKERPQLIIESFDPRETSLGDFEWRDLARGDRARRVSDRGEHLALVLGSSE